MYEEMMNNIIKKFGFEDIHTIIFILYVEREFDEQTIREMYDEYMSLSMLDEDEEEEDE